MLYLFYPIEIFKSSISVKSNQYEDFFKHDFVKKISAAKPYCIVQILFAEDEDEELEVEEPRETRQSVAPVEQVEAPVKKKKSFSSLMSFIRIPSKRNKNKKLEASQKQVETQEVRQSAVSSGFNRGVASKGKNKFTLI